MTRKAANLASHIVQFIHLYIYIYELHQVWYQHIVKATVSGVLKNPVFPNVCTNNQKCSFTAKSYTRFCNRTFFNAENYTFFWKNHHSVSKETEVSFENAQY